MAKRTRSADPRHFTFSWIDIAMGSLRARNGQQPQSQRRRGTGDLMWLILLAIIAAQSFLLYQTTVTSNDANTISSSFNQLSQFATSFSTKKNSQFSTKSIPRMQTEQIAGVGVNSGLSRTTIDAPVSMIHKQPMNIVAKASTVDGGVKPRLLIAVFTDEFWVYKDGSTSKDSRERQRSLLKLWNDKRICNYNAFMRDPSQFQECNVIWTFLLAAHEKTDMNHPTLRLDETPDEPVELLNRDLSKYKHFQMGRVGDLVEHDDFTLLNIRENMNEGKTPTFFNWAKNAADALNISYVGKCDLDAIVRLAPTLKFLHEDIPWRPKPTSTVLGCIKHKAKWNETRIGSESFWEQYSYHGNHLYLGGQFYIMSKDLINGYVRESRKPRDYFEGHEDHDALSMIQVAHKDRYIRWVSFPRNYRFWEHPVKGHGWWGRVWRREQRKFNEGNIALNHTFSVPEPLPPTTPSFLFVVGAKTSDTRKKYREELMGQPDKKACSLNDCMPEAACNVCFAFVMGGNPNGKNESIHDYKDLVIESTNKEQEPDLVVLNIRDNIDYGLGQTALHFLQSKFIGKLKTSFDMVLFCQVEYMLSIDEWNKAQSEQIIFNKNLLVGDVRDRDQYPMEFKGRGFENYFFKEQEDIHLYLGSDACFAVSTGLVSGIVEQARESSNVSKLSQVMRVDESRKRDPRIWNPRFYFVDSLGHDITTFAYLLRETALHWVPVLSHMKLWSKRQ